MLQKRALTQMFDDPLHPNVLKIAYTNGFFPMPHPQTGQILWFNPDPRAIFPLNDFHVSKSLQKFLNRTTYTLTFDHAFLKVMQGCADRPDTWITANFLEAYERLHRLGIAHSVEVWEEAELVGGVYGVAMGTAFFAESMFHRKTNASKMALHGLVKRLKEINFDLLEVQFMTPHLKSLGAIEIPSDEYLQRLRTAVNKDPTGPIAPSSR